jgi:hypothetical protein
MPLVPSNPPSEAARLRGQGLGSAPTSSVVTPKRNLTKAVARPVDTGSAVSFNPGAGAAPEDVKAGKSWHNIPSDGEIWSIDGVKHVAYQYEGGPFVYYKVPDKQWLDSRFLAGVPDAIELSAAEANGLGAIPMGSANLLANLGDTWQQGFDAGIDRQMEFSPWLADGEVVATILAATLEGRQLDPLELEQTEWFGSRNDGEVAYARFAVTASEQDFDDYHDRIREETRQALTRAGIRSPDQLLVDYVAQRGALGEWDDAKMDRQISSLANPFSSIELDEGLVSLLDGTTLDTLAGATEEVRAEVQRWLGPQHSQGFSDEQYRSWAGAALDDPNAANDLRDFLQGQRKALYPEYEDANLTYEDISTVWDNYLTNAWGETASDNQSWGVLDRIIRANSSEEAGRISRQEGLRLGVQKVEQDAMSTLGSAFGGQVQRSQT